VNLLFFGVQSAAAVQRREVRGAGRHSLQARLHAKWHGNVAKVKIHHTSVQ
jgi:hypothetical protein